MLAFISQILVPSQSSLRITAQSIMKKGNEQVDEAEYTLLIVITAKKKGKPALNAS